MAVTLREARQTVSRRLGGFKHGLVSLSPDTSDALGQRTILSTDLYDADKGSKGFANHFAWVGKYKNERRIRENGYRSLPYIVFTPPASGTYTITLYGYGTTVTIDFDATNIEIAAAIQDIGAGLGTVTVSGTTVKAIALPDLIDSELSAGVVLATGSIGAIEVNRAFTKALQIGDEWEIHGKMPVEDSDEIQGINWCINFAARKLSTIDKFPITPIRNSLGNQTFMGLSGEPWLTDHKQIIAVYRPTEWIVSNTFTPPASGTFTLTFDIATATYTTDDIAFNATGQEIQDAINTTLQGMSISSLVTPLTAEDSYTITIERTWFAEASIEASAGTMRHSVQFLRSPAMYPNVWNYSYDAELPFLNNVYSQEGYSLLVEAQRPANTWICPQESYGVLGTVWRSSTVGLVDDYDQINLPLDDLVTVAYAYAVDQLAKVGPPSERDNWAKAAKTAMTTAAGIKTFDSQRQDKPAGGYNVQGIFNAKGFFN